MILAFFAGLALVAQEPTVSVDTRLVEVSVVVHDKKGKPVSGLTQADFEVLENGKPQPIRFFAASQVAADTGEPLPPNVRSNRGGKSDGTPSRATVILFDAVNTPWESRQYAGRHLERFLKGFPPEDRVAVLLLGHSGLRLLGNDKRSFLPNFRGDALLAAVNEDED